MRIKYSPFIDHEVKLDSVEVTLDGDVKVNGNVKGKYASLTMGTAEALKIFRALKDQDIEGLAKVYGVG